MSLACHPCTTRCGYIRNRSARTKIYCWLRTLYGVLRPLLSGAPRSLMISIRSPGYPQGLDTDSEQYRCTCYKRRSPIYEYLFQALFPTPCGICFSFSIFSRGFLSRTLSKSKSFMSARTIAVRIRMMSPGGPVCILRISIPGVHLLAQNLYLSAYSGVCWYICSAHCCPLGTRCGSGWHWPKSPGPR